ncbi:DUF4910 domain-containing protein [Candidatus Micrarchaeota archaeon]|nr:DUF4910 domain-containing protein [Candidatus Micrarchaeota archaeon]
MNMLELLKKMCKCAMAPVSPGTDEVNRLAIGELPFKVHEYPTLSEHNGWIVPLNWHAKKATIHKDGKLIYDGMQHPLGVMGYSKSFSGKVSLEELKKHLSYRMDLPYAIGYHCDWYYKPQNRNWGFSMPYSLYRDLQSGEYEVQIETVSAKGTMKTLDLLIPGESQETIILNAHNCHGGQANDDISGVVVAIEVAKRLMKKKNRYSYRIIIAPEHFGTVFYLANLDEKEGKKFKYGIFLEMLGNNNRLALQKSFTGKSEIDRAAMNYLTHNHPDFHHDEFRNIIGNDETVWEAPGYEIPTISLSRAPYREYHTSYDNESIIFEEKLEESVKAVMGILNILDTNCAIERKFKGLIALSNPKYDLYKPTVDPSLNRQITKNDIQWNKLMDRMPRYFDGKTKVLDIAELHELDYTAVFNYINQFKEKKLVELLRN